MNNDFREYISWYDAKKIYKKKNMNRYEQEYYNNIKRIANALEKANKLKLIELSGEQTKKFTTTGLENLIDNNKNLGKYE